MNPADISLSWEEESREPRYESSMKVFISYSHSEPDRQTVRNIVTKLTAAGHKVWFDEQEIRAADSWEQAIREAVTNSDAVISIFSSERTQKNVALEMGIAIGAGKRIIPVLIRGGTPRGGIPPLIVRLNIIEADDSADAASRVTRALEKNEN